MRDTAVIGIGQWLAVPGDPGRNLETALGLVDALAGRGSDVVLLPEHWLCGFDRATLTAAAAGAAEPLDGPTVRRLGAAARSAGVWLAAGSVPERRDGAIYNTAVLFDRAGRVRAVHRKAYLYAPLGEDVAFAPGNSLTTCQTDELGTVGLSICFDGDFPETARTLRGAGARLVLHACAYEQEAESWWDRLYPAHAIENGQWWVLSNQCGTNPSVTLLGGSQVISPLGQIVATASRQPAAGPAPEPELLVAEVELRAGLERADRENEVLWRLARPGLPVRTAGVEGQAAVPADAASG